MNLHSGLFRQSDPSIFSGIQYPGLFYDASRTLRFSTLRKALASGILILPDFSNHESVVWKRHSLKIHSDFSWSVTRSLVGNESERRNYSGMSEHQYIRMYRKEFHVTTAKEGDIIDITPQVKETVRESRVAEGLVHVFVTGSTAAVTTIEHESGVLSDLSRALSSLAPDTIPYAHDSRWGDGNGRSHVKASIVGPSLVVPVSGNTPALGTWQQVVLLELDVREGRSRNIVVTVME